MKNITSRADVFPFPRSFLDHLNRRKKLICGVGVLPTFFAVMRCSLFFFCGVAVLTVPQCPPYEGERVDDKKARVGEHRLPVIA